ncbi:hypothetical protein [Kitasatospora sp. NPDC057198]|uniref:hypothetical protein n=1 Tax=Kitasatospora sp. NPDC057198 TaxID=3346046 RepID=UPI00362AAD18
MALLVVSGVSAGWYFGGGYERWREGRELRAMCRGTVGAADMKELFRSGEMIRASDREPGRGELAYCDAFSTGSAREIVFSIGWGDEIATSALDILGWRDYPSSAMLVPVGAGWSGVLDPHGGPTLVMVVPCGGAGAGKQLVVTLRGQHWSFFEDQDPEQRARFGRIGARVAERASAEWGCGVAPGGRIERLITEEEGTKPAPGTASGTCTGVPGKVQEWPTDAKAPIEECRTYLRRRPDDPSMKLSAFYPPFGSAVRPAIGLAGDSHGPGAPKHRGYQWATAACPGGEAFYLVQGTEEPGETTPREALAGFARESAKRHGCAEPVLP